MDANLNYNDEIFNFKQVFALVNTKHNPFSLGVNYLEIVDYTRMILNDLYKKGVRYLSIQYDNNFELIDIQKFNNELNVDYFIEITHSIIDYDMSPNDTITLGKLIKLNYRDLHNFLKTLKI